MKRFFLFQIYCLVFTGLGFAVSFDKHFTNETLRMDCLFSGNQETQFITLRELSNSPLWAGRHVNLNWQLLSGNGQIEMRETISNQLIYCQSFSSLFTEWLSTQEAKTMAKSFEHTFLLPMPQTKVNVTVRLFNMHRDTLTSTHFLINPQDKLIQKRSYKAHQKHSYIIKNGDPKECIDIAIVGEGYTDKEMLQFYKDANRTVESLFKHKAFQNNKQHFNIVAVETPSQESGTSHPQTGDWRKTIFQSHFYTFYSPRYLTTNKIFRLYDALEGIPVEHIIILANTEAYGGGGIYNEVALTTAHHPKFAPVVVHEFGHSFAGLADEYFYKNDVMSEVYSLKVEPWEKNVTTRISFKNKWEKLIHSSTPIPTPINPKKQIIGLYEGAAYAFKGIYRSSPDCRMKTNEAKDFCPACYKAIVEVIQYNTQELDSKDFQVR
jgi:hypothetical protein